INARTVSSRLALTTAGCWASEEAAAWSALMVELGCGGLDGSGGGRAMQLDLLDGIPQQVPDVARQIVQAQADPTWDALVTGRLPHHLGLAVQTLFAELERDGIA